MNICINENCDNEYEQPPEYGEYDIKRSHEYMGYCSRHCSSTDIAPAPHSRKKPAKAGMRIKGLEELHDARCDKRAVICSDGPFSGKPTPAASIINLQGRYLITLFRRGMWIYEKDK